jgi:hypothetical protein
MRNHFLRASSTAATGGDGGGGDDGGGGATCGANDSGGTNEWGFVTVASNSIFGAAGHYDFTSSIDTANKITYMASTQSNKFRVRKITNTGTISWSKEISLSDWTYFEARQGHSLSNGKQIFVGPAQYGNSDYRITVVCINADSTVEWCKSLESTGTGDQNQYSFQGETWGLDVDSNDNIYIVAKHTYHKAFKINSSGALQWFKVHKIQNESGSTLTGVNAAIPTGMVVNDSYIYVLNMRRNHRYGFLYVLNTSDGSLYAKRWVTNDSTYSDRYKYWNYLKYAYQAGHLDIDSSGNLYVSYVTLDSSNYPRNLYLAKINSSLNSISWSKEYNLSGYYVGQAYGGQGAGIARTTGNGNIVFAAMGISVSNSQFKRVIIGVFDSTGALSWQRSISGYDDIYPHPFRILNDVVCDSADHFYITTSLPWAGSAHGNTSYEFYQNIGEGVVKHTTCSATAADTEMFTTSNNSDGLLPANQNSWAEFQDDTIITGEATGDFQISSSAYTNESSYPSDLSDFTTTLSGYYAYSATSHTLTVADISSSDDKKELDYI